MAKRTIISDVKVDYKQAQKILKIVGDAKKELDNKDYYISLEEDIEQKDEGGEWSWEEIVERYNLNYGQKYDKRKLQEAFRNTMTELDRAYQRKHKGEMQGCLRWFKKEGREEYCFRKKSEILLRDFTPVSKELLERKLDEELDELSEIFDLALQFNDRKRQTFSGIMDFGTLLGKNDNRIVAFGRKGGITLEEMLREEINCYIMEELGLYEVKERIGEIFKRSSVLKDKREMVKSSLEKSLNDILSCYREEIFRELENIKISSKCAVVMDKASIRTYTPRGQKNSGATKDGRAVILFKDEKDYFDVSQIQSFIQDAYNRALSLKGKGDSNSSSSWNEKIEKIEKIFDQKKADRKILNQVELDYLKRIFMEELIVWVEEADLLINNTLGEHLLERIRYYRNEYPKSQQIEINKKTGEFFSSVEEKKFWEKRRGQN